ncbi:MAG: hypothetical protein C0611_10545 [Desulfobacteraceae bacterium]|nr:MAG: hypothetical protein C0611_10545 [Desulfobacteraceae bacterium]
MDGETSHYGVSNTEYVTLKHDVTPQATWNDRRQVIFRIRIPIIAVPAPRDLRGSSYAGFVKD